MSEPLLKYRQPTAPQDILAEAVPARAYTEGSGLNLARAALFGVGLDKVKDIIELLRTYRGGRPNSLIMGGPLGWSWHATLDDDHHGELTKANAHRHGDLANIGIDDHHARDHATRHHAGGADALALGSIAGNLTDAQHGSRSVANAHAHSHLSGIGVNDHHARDHVLATNTGLGATHTMSGATAGHVLRATSATAAQFAQLQHGDLGGVTADQHHAQSHSHASHTGIGANDHHAQLHNTTHQDLGADEINIAGLAGEPAELATHKSATTGIHGVGASTVDSVANRDTAITTHKGDASAHHVKTTSFTDITDRAGVTKLNWTADKLLLGAGVGVDPTEVIRDEDALIWTPPDASCVLYLPGAPSCGSVIHDLSDYDNHGTIVGPTWVRNSQGLWVLDFDGDDDYINCGDSATLNPAKMGIEFWLFGRAATPAYEGIILHGAWDSSYQMYVAGVREIRFFVKNADNTVVTIGSAAQNSYVGNTWMHVMATFDGSLGSENLKLFKNGVQIAQGDLNGDVKTVVGDTVIGKSGIGDSYWNGRLPLMRVYNDAPSGAVALEHYQQERHLLGV